MESQSKLNDDERPFGEENVKQADEIDALRHRYDGLRAELVEAAFECDRLKLHEVGQVRLDYMIQAGCWGSRELIAQYESARCRRRYMLACESLSHEGRVNVGRVEALVAHEFENWDKRHAFILSVYEGFAHKAMASDVMEDDERAELDALYRSVLGRVHPALGRAGDEARAELFQKARQAYENYDLETMRTLDEASAAWAQARLKPDEAHLSAVTLVLEAQVEIERAKLESARMSFPHSVREKISDQEWLGEWRAYFGDLIAQHERSGARYQEAYRSLCER